MEEGVPAAPNCLCFCLSVPTLSLPPGSVFPRIMAPSWDQGWEHHICALERHNQRAACLPLPPSTGKDPPLRASIISTLFICPPARNLSSETFPALSSEVSFLNTTTSLTVQLVFQVIFHFMSTTFSHEMFLQAPALAQYLITSILASFHFAFPSFQALALISKGRDQHGVLPLTYYIKLNLSSNFLYFYLCW